jgi:hypothetical protein
MVNFLFIIGQLLIAVLVINNLFRTITPTRNPQDDWPENLWLSSFVVDPTSESTTTTLKVNSNEKMFTKLFDAENNKVEYGRFHHGENEKRKDTLTNQQQFEAIDFSFPSSMEKTKYFLQKMTTLKEWSFSAFTDGQEWFCGSAIASLQLASGFFAYCYNAKIGRSFHIDLQSVEFFILGGYGTQFKHDDDDEQQQRPYVNNGFLEWDFGKISNDHVAWSRHGYNKSTGEYDVHVRVTAIEYVLDESTEYKSLREGDPVIMEFKYSFPVFTKEKKKSNSKDDESIVSAEGMTLVFPLGASSESQHRIGLTTKYSGIQSTVKKFSIKKKVSLEIGEKGEKEKTIVDFDLNNNNKQEKKFLAFLDWTRAEFPRHTTWYWICFGMTVTSKKANVVIPSSSSSSLQHENEDNHQQEGIETQIGMQLTALSYRGSSKHGKNYSLESSLWINGNVFVIDAEVVVVEDKTQLLIPFGKEKVGIDGRSKMKQKLGRTYKINFDTTKNFVAQQQQQQQTEAKNEKDFWRLEMTFTRVGAHVQDFGEFWPLHGGALEHQWGNYVGELTHFVAAENNAQGLKLNHVYRFSNVPGIFEDHDTIW